MTDLIRDTLFGHFIRLVTKNKYLQYAEERDPQLWKQYLDRDKTLNMAMYGHPELSPEEQKEKDIKLEGNDASESPSGDEDSNRLRGVMSKQTTHEHKLHSALTNQRVDTEKGRDAAMIGWWGDHDAEVCFFYLLLEDSCSWCGERS